MTFKAIITKRGNEETEFGIRSENAEIQKMGLDVEMNLPQGVLVSGDIQTIKETERKSTMTTLRRNATLALLALTLFGCADKPKPQPKPQQATTTTTTTVTKTTQTTRAVSLRIGMKGSEAIALAGIPCPPSTIKAIDEGANMTLNYKGHSYVFSKGVLEAVR